MGKSIHGGFKNTKGRGNLHSLTDNLPDLTRRFPLAPCGKFGDPGKGARVIKSPAPVGTAYEFFNRISRGYETIKTISYRDGSKKGCVAKLKDGTIITLRKKSTSDGSPAVDINITSPGRVKPHKIHFIKEN
ncbi:MAG: hypothetical protein ACI4QT_07440 [Kiritimatiellia bacterium]